MIAHSVTVTLKDEAPPESVEAFIDELRSMAQSLDVVRFYECGRGLGLRPGGADLGVIAFVEDERDLHAYLDHPLHLAIAERYAPIIHSRSSIQLQVRGVPVAHSDSTGSDAP